MNSNKNKGAQLAPLNHPKGNNNHSNNNLDTQLLETSKTVLAQQEEALMMSEGKQTTLSSCCFSSSSSSVSVSRNSSTSSSCCSAAGKRWFLLLSMSITLIITAILLAMLTVSLLDQEDTCFNSFPFQQYSYKLFSTKTAYTSAYNFLNINNNPRAQVYEKFMRYDDESMPSIFSKSDSLKSLNEKLSKDQNCRLRQLHYFGRHAARYPSANEIDKINKHLSKVQARIDLSKMTASLNSTSKLPNGSSSAGQQSNNSNNVCFNPLAQYKQWTSFLSPDHANLILDSGVYETQAIALRLKSIHPELFDRNLSKIEIGTTEELRTAQTALVFLKQMTNFNLDFCMLSQFNSPLTSDYLNNQQSSFVDNHQHPSVDELNSNPCFRTFINRFQKEKLQFHKKCQTHHKELFPIIHNLNLKEPNRTKFISSSVSKKLKLNKDDSLTSDETHALYKICEYESAFAGSSIWCNLFSESELKFYEFLNDVDDFFNQAYGHPDQARSACPVTTELIKSFKSAARTGQQQAEAHFYFTHSQVIQKILAASVDLEQDPEYSIKSLLGQLQAGTVPNSRQWRTSLFTPFSANLAFSLYECPRQKMAPSSQDDSTTIDFDVSESPFKVVASLNEQPILLDGCSDYICDLKQLLSDSRINKEKRCKLEDICKKEVVVT